MSMYYISIQNDPLCPQSNIQNLSALVNETTFEYGSLEIALRAFYRIIAQLLAEKKYDLYVSLVTYVACGCNYVVKELIAQRKIVKPNENCSPSNTPIANNISARMYIDETKISVQVPIENQIEDNMSIYISRQPIVGEAIVDKNFIIYTVANKLNYTSVTIGFTVVNTINGCNIDRELTINFVDIMP